MTFRYRNEQTATRNSIRHWQKESRNIPRQFDYKTYALVSSYKAGWRAFLATFGIVGSIFGTFALLFYVADPAGFDTRVVLPLVVIAFLAGVGIGGKVALDDYTFSDSEYLDLIKLARIDERESEHPIDRMLEFDNPRAVAVNTLHGSEEVEISRPDVVLGSFTFTGSTLIRANEQLERGFSQITADSLGIGRDYYPDAIRELTARRFAVNSRGEHQQVKNGRYFWTPAGIEWVRTAGLDNQ